MSDHEAMRQALEALKKATKHLPVHFDSHFEAIATLRAALAKDALQRLTDVQQEIEAVLAQFEKEPVAWQYKTVEAGEFVSEHRPVDVGVWQEIECSKPLYTHPPQRKPLTDEEILLAYQKQWHFHPAEEPNLAKGILQFARAIEQAHGIGEKP